MQDTANTLARTMIDDVGYIRAVIAAVDLVLTASSLHRFRCGVAILVAVVFA